jgi:hypothetical protein
MRRACLFLAGAQLRAAVALATRATGGQHLVAPIDEGGQCLRLRVEPRAIGIVTQPAPDDGAPRGSRWRRRGLGLEWTRLARLFLVRRVMV